MEHAREMGAEVSPTFAFGSYNASHEISTTVPYSNSNLTKIRYYVTYVNHTLS